MYWSSVTVDFFLNKSEMFSCSGFTFRISYYFEVLANFLIFRHTVIDPLTRTVRLVFQQCDENKASWKSTYFLTSSTNIIKYETHSFKESLIMIMPLYQYKYDGIDVAFVLPFWKKKQSRLSKLSLSKQCSLTICFKKRQAYMCAYRSMCG